MGKPNHTHHPGSLSLWLILHDFIHNVSSTTNARIPIYIYPFQVKILYLRNLDVCQSHSNLNAIILQFVPQQCLEKVFKFKNYAFVHLTTRIIAEHLMEKLTGKRPEFGIYILSVLIFYQIITWFETIIETIYLHKVFIILYLIYVLYKHNESLT